MKTCSLCKNPREYSEFYKRKTSKDGLSYHCKKCELERKKKFFLNNIDHCREIKNKSYKKNKEKIRLQQKNKYHEDIEVSRQKCRDKYWKNHKEIRLRINLKHKTPEFRKKAAQRQEKWRKEKKDIYNASLTLWRKKNLMQTRANQKLRDAIRFGKIVKPELCQNCSEKKELQAHHEDYSKPLDVIWLCHLCHCHEHNKLMDVK